MKIAIVGGGWAGLSAAITAVDHGLEVHLYESGSRLGGRARSVDGKVLTPDAATAKVLPDAFEGTVWPEAIDNGQHILLGAYTATIHLMRRLGQDPDALFHHLPLNVQSANGGFALKCTSRLPSPLHIAAGFLLAKGLTVTDKWSVLRAMQQLKRDQWRTPKGATVQDWLQQHRQSHRAETLLWEPLCIATMNTPVNLACAQLFANVLRDSVGSADRSASNMLIPKVSLSELWPDSVLALAGSELPLAATRKASGNPVAGLRVRLSTTVKAISLTEDTPESRIKLDGFPDQYDAVIVACNTPSSARLLEQLPPVKGSGPLIAALKAFRHAPIATLTLQFSRPWQLPAPMLMLHEDRARGHFGQWLFQGQKDEDKLVHIVISDAGELASRPRKEAVACLVEQLEEQLRVNPGAPMPPITAHALIIEKRATFLAVPGLKRPGHRTPWRGVWLAGDWTDTGYPAVLEGAVRSGRDAVRETLGLRT